MNSCFLIQVPCFSHSAIVGSLAEIHEVISSKEFSEANTATPLMLPSYTVCRILKYQPSSENKIEQNCLLLYVKKYNIYWLNASHLFLLLHRYHLKQRIRILCDLFSCNLFHKSLQILFIIFYVVLFLYVCIHMNQVTKLRGWTTSLLRGVHSRRKHRNGAKLFILKKLFPKSRFFQEVFFNELH